jgi:hypothetical protein
MQKTTRIFIGWAFFVIMSAIGLLHSSFAQALEFDPEHRIASLGLPDKDPREITIRTIQWALGMLGLVATIMIIIGGMNWMMSEGNEKKVEQSKKILSGAVVGLFIVMIAWALVTFVFNRVNEFTV